MARYRQWYEDVMDVAQTGMAAYLTALADPAE